MLKEKKVEEYIKRKSSSQATSPSQRVQDAECHFLMILLTSLRAIPANRKLVLRQD